uniref:Uncharacterized protein n=1 Tax=Solanum tuberosum TaxID=4113 RepID=M1DP34_SOLTU
MTTQEACTGGIEENYDDQGDSPQVPQVPVDLMSSERIRNGFHWLTQVGIEILDIYGSKMEEDPLEFIEEILRVLVEGSKEIKKKKIDMTTQEACTSGFKENYDDQGASPQDPKVPIDLMSNERIRYGFH